jgi:8-oxo-dGTP diphosphatase
MRGCRSIPPNIKAKMAERKPKLVVGVLAKNKNRYLLAKEVLEGGKTWWLVPGGKVEFGETIEEAAKREIR